MGSAWNPREPVNLQREYELRVVGTRRHISRAYVVNLLVVAAFSEVSEERRAFCADYGRALRQR